jgi:hypothetical protein
MSDPHKTLLQVFAEECKRCLIDYVSPFAQLARWLQHRIRK